MVFNIPIFYERLSVKNKYVNIHAVADQENNLLKQISESNEVIFQQPTILQNLKNSNYAAYISHKQKSLQKLHPTEMNYS